MDIEHISCPFYTKKIHVNFLNEKWINQLVYVVGNQKHINFSIGIPSPKPSLYRSLYLNDTTISYYHNTYNTIDSTRSLLPECFYVYLSGNHSNSGRVSNILRCPVSATTYIIQVVTSYLFKLCIKR